MKISLKSITAFFLVSFVFISILKAQSNFEGTIIYTITYTDMPAEMKGYEAMLPKDLTIQIKGNKSRVEQSQAMGKNVIISDADQKNGFMEMDMGGQKFRMNISTEDFDDESNKMTNIEYLDETKTILGYPCKKAIMKDASGQVEMAVFYTDKISNKGEMKFVGLKGFPLQYTMTQQKMTMVMLATKISEETISDKVFEKSEGFKDITQADLQKMMGGG